jgi:predicted HD phosphohydrolase
VELTSVDELFDLLEGSAAHDDGEAVDLRAHSLQCAHLLSVDAPDDLDLQVAGLVHDVYHVVDPAADAVHDREGARLVEPLLGARVARLVAGHVVAKRYLVSTDPAYRSRLSARSVETLAHQGGDLDMPTRRAMEASPDRDALITLRRADDRAKAPDAVVPSLAHWRPIVERVAVGDG